MTSDIELGLQSLNMHHYLWQPPGEILHNVALLINAGNYAVYIGDDAFRESVYEPSVCRTILNQRSAVDSEICRRESE